MSDAYEIEGVTVTPQGGGFYLLTAEGLASPAKVRGKEAADQQAAEIAAQLRDARAVMEQQPATIPPIPPAPENSAVVDELSVLKAQLLQAQIDKTNAEAALAQARAQNENLVTRTIHVEGEIEPALNTVPGAIPRKYDGIFDDKAKAALKARGVDMVDIRLEDNPDIPPTGLFIGHNGRGYIIMPGVEVSVPSFLCDVLNDAVMAAAVTDSKTGKVIGYRNKMRYAYTRLNI